MSKLIDADKLDFGFPVFDVDMETAQLIMAVNKAITEAPAVDAVEVVRCKDCKYRNIGSGDVDEDDRFNNRYCQWTMDDDPLDDDFCSNGTRMDGA